MQPKPPIHWSVIYIYFILEIHCFTSILTKNKLKINRASMNGSYVEVRHSKEMSCFRVLFMCFRKKQYCPTILTIIFHDSYNNKPFFVRNVTGVSLEMIWPWNFDVRLRSQKPVFHSTLFCIVFSITRRVRICFQK